MPDQQTLNISVALNGACRCQCSIPRPEQVNNIQNGSFELPPAKADKYSTKQKTVEA
ncbi:MAG: hypothetical protein VX879_04060 [Pseudomonadota bacterium]|nr:hypothetical protein [Pseudomonadota bacterium]MEC9101759.1 hypothetical protein [Pseudomonadota bacterium]